MGILHMLQWLYTYVASVCFKCFICFFRSVLQMFLFECCICITHMFANVFIRMLHMFCIGFSSIFRCFRKCSICKCFIFLRTHDAKVSYGYFKNTSDVVHVAMWLTYHSRLLELLGCRTYVWEAKRWSVGGCGHGKRHGRSPPGASMQQPWASGCGHLPGRPSASTALFTLSSRTIWKLTCLQQRFGSREEKVLCTSAVLGWINNSCTYDSKLKFLCSK